MMPKPRHRKMIKKLMSVIFAVKNYMSVIFAVKNYMTNNFTGIVKAEKNVQDVIWKKNVQDVIWKDSPTSRLVRVTVSAFNT